MWLDLFSGVLKTVAEQTNFGLSLNSFESHPNSR